MLTCLNHYPPPALYSIRLSAIVGLWRSDEDYDSVAITLIIKHISMVTNVIIILHLLNYFQTHPFNN